MRWILVFLFLYLIPLIALFRNYSNFKRSCIYSSIYVVLVSTIVITNIYMSGLNKIKEAMYYHNYVSEESDDNSYASNFSENPNPKNKDIYQDKDENKIVDNQEEISKDDESEIKEVNENSIDNAGETELNQKNDKEIIFEFKKQIYDIETVALMPMRDCMPYTKNISQNIKNLSNIKKDLEYAHEKCEEVISMYKKMEIPTLFKDEYIKELNNARNDVKKAYELRSMAMESAIQLVDTKNPKYVGKITQYLDLSDKQISSFKERISDLNAKIDSN